MRLLMERGGSQRKHTLTPVGHTDRHVTINAVPHKKIIPLRRKPSWSDTWSYYHRTNMHSLKLRYIVVWTSRASNPAEDP